MVRRVWRTKKSPEDYQNQKLQETEEPKDYEGSRKPRNPGGLQESGSKQESKEDCQVSRLQNPKSLEEWHNIRVRN